MINRLSDWWTRSFWGWLIFLGPVLCYLSLSLALDVVGLGAANPLAPPVADPGEAFRQPEEIMLRSVAGRLEYAIASVLLLLVSVFSILWSLPKILAAVRNPFGGLTGVALALGVSGALYWLYCISDYNLRQIFADDILEMGEATGVLAPWRLSLFGADLGVDALTPSGMLAATRDVVYFFSNAAPWFLIVLAARTASYEPKRYRSEPPEQLRQRLIVLQIAVILAAANIVLSVAYTRAMVHWPPTLLKPEYAEVYLVATSRYTALWGALGTALLAAALAPAMVSLLRQFDRIADRELIAELGRPPSYGERIAWREKNGLVVSAQQIVTTGAAVIAPVMTSPTLEAGAAMDAELESPPAIVAPAPL